MSPADARRAGGRPGAGVVTDRTADRDNGGFEDLRCTCCEPRNPLVMRPDFGTLGDGSAEFALCVLHVPEPIVYRNRGDGLYIRADGLSLSAAGEIVDAAGAIVAAVADDGFQRLTTIDDDEPRAERPAGPAQGPGGATAARPRTVHVDLSQDDFYYSPRP